MSESSTSAMFPILDQSSGLKGIARLVNEAEDAGAGHLVEFRSLPVRSVLNRSVSKRRLSMTYSINPYRGCEFGCRYCYARYTHEFLAPADEPEGGEKVSLRDPEAFERRIFIKRDAAWLMEQELRRIDPAGEIALGTATDPYQPIERRARVTRSLLEVFARQRGYRLGIVTKSDQILRDVDLLKQIARNNTLVVHVTITTTDASLARKLEPRAPRPDLRFGAVWGLREAGIRTGVLNSPLLPGLTDNAQAMDEVARQAKQANASFLAGEPLFLKPCSRPTYLSFVREHFPALEAENAARFAHAEFASRAYRQEMAGLISAACRRHGLAERSTDALLTRDVGRKPVASVGAKSQGELFASA